jgi:hypothetical protein
MAASQVGDTAGWKPALTSNGRPAPRREPAFCFSARRHAKPRFFCIDNLIALSYVMTMSEVERQLTPLIVTLATGVLIWLVIQWIRNAACRPEPWGAKWEKTIEEGEAPPVCAHCSAPYAETDWFCPTCGCSVGDYNNCNPYLYLFSLGEGLRRGTSEAIPVNWLTVGGYLLLPLALFSVLAPFYWVMLFLNLGRQSHPAPAVPTSPG